jgi:hypothetical protein
MTVDGARRRTRRRLFGPLIASALGARRGDRIGRCCERGRQPCSHAPERRTRGAASAAAAAAAAPTDVDRAAYQAAVEAYIWGFPLVVMARTRARVRAVLASA